MQFIDLNAQYRALKTEIEARIKTVLDHGQFIMGPEVAELERRLMEFIGVKHCLSCANGTDALQLLYMAYGIGIGDAVFCADITMIASIEPACMLGAAPVFCDVRLDTYNIDATSLERQVRAVLAEGKYHPKAVVAVDIFGNPCDYETIEAVCRKYDLILIEDAAQSFGSTYHGGRCGSFGDSAITSFFPAKPLGCYGDGGAVFTNDDEKAELCGSLRIHGKGPGGKYANIRIGVNSRLDTIQAAILLPKLEIFPSEFDKRQIAAKYYDEAFSGRFVTQIITPGGRSAYAQYVLLAKDSAERQTVIERLDAAGIPNMIYYPAPMHRLPVFEAVNSYGETYPSASGYCERTLSLPFHPYLTKKEQDRVISVVLATN